MKWTLFLLCITDFFRNGLPEQQDGFPKFRVKKDSIINAAQSLRNGAVFLSKESVKSSKECYRMCCERSSCTMGLMRYKKSVESTSKHIEKTCFLFNCNNPSVCVYSNHPDYAAIELLQPEEPTPKSSVIKGDACPEGVPVAMCFANPCENAECDADPSASCKPYYCGGCFAHFYDSKGMRVQCEAKTTTKSPDLLHPVQSSEITDDNVNDLAHKNEQDSGNDHKKEPGTTQPPTEEIHERRQWVDNNPNFPTPIWADWNIRHTKPQERIKKPTISETKPSPEKQAAKTSPASEATTTKEINIDEKLEEIHEKVWKPPTKPHPHQSIAVECPNFKCSFNCEVFFVDESGCKTCNCVIGKKKIPLKDERNKMNVTLLVESKDVRVIQNSAVVPLIIGLIISIIMLVVVVVRLKSIKGKLRRRPFATDDADYLINGMYL